MYVEGASALNRVRWSHSGKEIATGDSEGQVQVYDVGEVRCRSARVICLQSIQTIQIVGADAQLSAHNLEFIPSCSVCSAANLRAQG